MSQLVDALSGGKYQRIMAETWGHLAPKGGTTYPCEMVFAHSEYGDIILISSRIDGLEDSPWLFEDMNEYIGSRFDPPNTKKYGVFRFNGTYTKSKNGKCRFCGEVTEVK